MTIQHGIIAQSWQLSHRLKYIVFPLASKEGHMPISIFDSIYLMEEWTRFSMHPHDLVCRSMASPLLESSTWLPAMSMPSRIAQYWFEVEDINSYRCWDKVPSDVWEGSGLTSALGDRDCSRQFRPMTEFGRGLLGVPPMTLPPMAQAAKNWFSLYPTFSLGDEYPVTVLSLKSQNSKPKKGLNCGGFI